MSSMETVHAAVGRTLGWDGSFAGLSIDSWPSSLIAQPNRLAALLSGAVDAAVLTHPETIIARKQGFNELIFYGDQHRIYLGRGGGDRKKYFAEARFRPPFRPGRPQDVLLY